MRILPVSDKFRDYADKVYAALRDADFRVTLDDTTGRVNAMVKVAQEDKINYMLIVGGRDEEAGTVSVRAREADRGDLGAVPLEAFIEKARSEIDSFGDQMVTVE